MNAQDTTRAAKNCICKTALLARLLDRRNHHAGEQFFNTEFFIFLNLVYLDAASTGTRQGFFRLIIAIGKI